jgi:hypothetical protein
MLLYHLTGCDNRPGIAREGFRPGVRTPGYASFSLDQASDVKYVITKEWWVIADVPDDELADALKPNDHVRFVPLDVVNRHRSSFRYERHNGHRCMDCRDLP